MKHKTFFLDRDGTLNVDYNYVHTKEEWTWCEGAIDALNIIQSKGFKIVVVTNQSGIVKGKFTEYQVKKLHRWVDEQLESYGITIDLWNFAPYHPEFEKSSGEYPPEDRKPGLGMFRKSDRELGIKFNESFMAGDKISDLKPAIELGMTPVFIRSRHESNQNRDWLRAHNIEQFDTLLDAVNAYLS